MKKHLRSIVCILLVFCASLTLFSCKRKNPSGNGDGGSNGEVEDIVAKDAVWDEGSTLFVYSDINIYTDLDKSSFFVDLMNNDAGLTVKWYSSDNVKEANSIIVGKTESDLSKAAYRQLESMSEKADDLNYSNWLIYSNGMSVALAYNSDFAFKEVIEQFISNYGSLKRFEPQKGVLISGEISNYNYVQELRDKRIESSLNSLTNKFGEETVKALKDLYSMYSYEDYIWLADLWCPETGGFYFSNSARNTEGYLPDLESTAQALNYLENAGMISRDALSAYLPEEMREKLANFVVNLQSDVDGYFYHPQWGASVSSSRKGRDLTWATELLVDLRARPLYDTPDGTLKGTVGVAGTVSPTSSNLSRRISVGCVSAVSKVVEVSTSNLPSYLQTVEKFKTYILDMDIRYDSYGDGNTLAAQNTQIINADRALWLKQNPGASSASYSPAKPAKGGYIEFLVDHLADIQDPSTGLFEAKDSNNDAYYRDDNFIRPSTL